MSPERIFGCKHEFVGRERDLERIVAAAYAGESLAVLAAPGVGATELLRQAYDELFASQSTIPFYFELKRSDRDAACAAKRFAREFLAQSVAHARRDPRLVAIQPSLDEIARLAPADSGWIDAAIEAQLSKSSIAGDIAVVTRARQNVTVLVDGLDRVTSLREAGQFLEAIAALRGVSVIASGLRRAIYGRTLFQQISLEALPFESTAAVVGAMAAYGEIELTDVTRDLIAVQTDGSLHAVDQLLAQAADDHADLTAFASVERLYTNSVLGGRIARDLKRKVLRPLPKMVDQNELVRLLAETLTSDNKRLSLRHWRQRSRDLDDPAFGRLIRHLHVQEVVSADDGFVNMSVTSRVLCDYLEARARLLDSPGQRAVIVGRAMVHNIGRAPRLMTEFYRSNAAVGVRDLLATFDGQSIVRAAIDYGPFKRQLKGRDEDAVMAALRSSADIIELPRIVYTTDAVTFYSPIAELCDRNRSAVGLSDAGEAWFAAEIDSKLEADAPTAEFWCDRLEMAAANSGFDRYRFWLIAPEGFTDDALDVLAEREAYGSSRRQVELLRRLLTENIEDADAEPDAATNYELTVQMGEEGEIIAARTFGEIAEKHHIPSKPAAQIKTAIIEALINAAEHSLSPDQRVELAFHVTTRSITITTANRGLRLTSHMLARSDPPSERRGWGLKLIQQLMDEVRVEPTDDGTRLVMVKRFF